MNPEEQEELAKLEQERIELHRSQPAILDFSVLEYGNSDDIDVVTLTNQTLNHTNNYNSPMRMQTLPCGLPPLENSDLKSQLEKILLSPEELSIFQLHNVQEHWPHHTNAASLYHVDLKSNQTTLDVKRDPITGELLGYEEISLENANLTSRNSTSLQRKPISENEKGPVTGQSTNLPFWPGGFDPAKTGLPETELEDVTFDRDLLKDPPDFDNGIDFDVVTTSENQSECAGEADEIKISDILSADFVSLPENETVTDSTKKTEKDATDENSAESVAISNLETIEEVDSLIQETKIIDTKAAKKSAGRERSWCIPINLKKSIEDFHEKIPDMAFTWPFELDAFQKQAILMLEKHNNVFVAAHTSAGKTVVAEYAIALAIKHVAKAVYTSPIKALSNQKFREFKQNFDVGLLTGDVQIKPEASCLIMTTEILRSMLYNGSDTIRDIEWVIFDEVHYIDNKERGVVWEEVLIMLPDHVGLVLLSATVTNAQELADWIGRTKQKQIYLISTTKRPVPLEHYLYRQPNEKDDNYLFKIVNSDGTFLSNGCKEALTTSTAKSDSKGKKATMKKPKVRTESGIWLSLIRSLAKNEKLPAVAFVFSRKRCDKFADSSCVANLTTASEKSFIRSFIKKSISILNDSDKNIPQIQWISRLLENGIGVHHSGILPILKELVEMLFQKGVVKFLFATETFAMGVNMPARSVIFDAISKFDGDSLRRLHAGEYIQMAGRAGRRGLDKTGTVIILYKEEVKEIDLRQVMLGKPQKLNSQFRLTYSMVLNILRVEDMKVEDMIYRSFAEVHKQRDLVKNERQVAVLRSRLDSRKLDCPICQADIRVYFETLCRLNILNKYLQERLLLDMQAKMRGKIIVVNSSRRNNTLGIVLKISTDVKRNPICNTFVLSWDLPANDFQSSVNDYRSYSMDLSIPDGHCYYVIEDIGSDGIVAISKKTCDISVDKVNEAVTRLKGRNARDLESNEVINAALLELRGIAEKNPQGLQQTLSFNDIRRKSPEDMNAQTEYFQLSEKIKSYKCTSCPRFEEHFLQAKDQFLFREELEDLEYALSKENLELSLDYHHRKELLRSLGYIDAKDIVQLKGRVACEISNCELLLTELIFENILSPMEPERIAALISCTAFQQRKCSEPNLTEDLSKGKCEVLEKAALLDMLERKHNIECFESYEEKLQFGLTEVVYEWAKEKPFADIMKLTDVSEGVIVRSMQRLESTCMEVKKAARIIGDPVLCDKMLEASRMIKRDICFAASLYTR